MKEKTTGIVKFRLDQTNPPKLTPEAREQLKRLRAMKDEDIDYSDIPSQRGAVWTRPGR